MPKGLQLTNFIHCVTYPGSLVNIQTMSTSSWSPNRCCSCINFRDVSSTCKKLECYERLPCRIPATLYIRRCSFGTTGPEGMPQQLCRASQPRLVAHVEHCRLRGCMTHLLQVLQVSAFAGGQLLLVPSLTQKTCLKQTQMLQADLPQAKVAMPAKTDPANELLPSLCLLRVR